MNRLAPFLISCLISLSYSHAEDAAEPSPSDLDFWLGEWTVSWTDEEGNSYHGSNTIERILDEKVIQESFDARDALDFVGHSVSTLDPVSNKWKQTWVDTNGSYMDFEGYKRGDTFIFHRQFTNAKGIEVENRMVFKDITENSLTWDWEGRRLPDGKWKLLWQLNYERKNPSPTSTSK